MRCGGPDPSRDREVSRPPGQRLVSNLLPDAALAGAFVARWCIGNKVARSRLCRYRPSRKPVEGPSELREVSRWFGTGRSRGSAARQVEWLPRVEGEEVRFMQIWPAVSGAS
jgi:hypothetical protein